MRRLFVFASAFVFAGATAAWGQAKSGDKEWAAIVEATKKEGKVVVEERVDDLGRGHDFLLSLVR